MDNLQTFIKDNEHLIGDVFKDKFSDTDNLLIYMGVIVCIDDYYYAFVEKDTGKLILSTCCSNIEFAYKKVKDKFENLVGMELSEAKRVINYFHRDYKICETDEEFNNVEQETVNIRVQDGKVTLWKTL